MDQMEMKIFECIPRRLPRRMEVRNLECVPVHIPKRLKHLTFVFMQLFTEKNSDGTKNLRLKGNELRFRIQRQLHKDDIPDIIKYMFDVSSIVKLDLSYNNIGDEGFITLIYDFLKHPNNLRDLNVIHNDITIKGIEALCADNSTILTLRSLRLAGNKFGSRGGQKISLLLAENKTIEYLDIAETDQTLSSMSFILAMIRHDRGFNNMIKVIDISRIIPCFERYQYQTNHLAESVGDMLRFNTILIEIHLQKCQLTAHDIELMLIGLKHNRTLKFLDLGYNRIADMGIELLGNYLKTRPDMLGLNVAGNMIGSTGARALSFTLPFSKIRLLDISYNRIQPDGILDILYTIKKPYVLRFFSLWGNKFNHASNSFMYRLFLAGILDQQFCDCKIYKVDGIYYAARYPSDNYKNKFYCELNYGYPPTLKIIRNDVTPSKYKVDFKHYPQLPLLKCNFK